MTAEEKREKVVLGLESCSGKAIFEAKCPFNCPYAVSTGKMWTEPDCCEQLIKDALALLKEHEEALKHLRILLNAANGTAMQTEKIKEDIGWMTEGL